MTFNVNQLRLDIEALIRDNPDLVEDEVLRHDMLDAETDLFSALTALVNAAAAARAMMAALGGRMDNLGARHARFARREEALRGLMLKLMQSGGLKKIELADATLAQRAAPPQIVGTPDPATLPDDLCKVSRVPDRAAIREALMAHREVPGVVLSNAPPILTIKVK